MSSYDMKPDYAADMTQVPPPPDCIEIWKKKSGASEPVFPAPPIREESSVDPATGAVIWHDTAVPVTGKMKLKDQTSLELMDNGMGTQTYKMPNGFKMTYNDSEGYKTTTIDLTQDKTNIGDETTVSIIIGENGINFQYNKVDKSKDALVVTPISDDRFFHYLRKSAFFKDTSVANACAAEWYAYKSQYISPPTQPVRESAFSTDEFTMSPLPPMARTYRCRRRRVILPQALQQCLKKRMYFIMR